MNPQLVWAQAALDDLDEVLVYIGHDSPERAYRFVDELIASAESRLATAPYAGRSGSLEGTRELVLHKRYLCIYSVAERDEVPVVRILRVMHTARNWPSV